MLGSQVLSLSACCVVILEPIIKVHAKWPCTVIIVLLCCLVVYDVSNLSCTHGSPSLSAGSDLYSVK